MIWIILVTIAAYLVGSIPIGLILCKKIKGVDIRTIGSGNIGTANAIRALGPLWGGMVFLGDCLKGAVPVLVIMGINKWAPGSIPQNLYYLSQVTVGFASIMGHNYSIFLGFTGGKGIATSFGVFVVLDWRAAVLSFLVWVICIAATKISSLGSLMGSLSLPILLLIFKAPIEYIAFSFIATAFAFYKHRENIGRLLRGEERKISDKPKEKAKPEEKK